VISRVRPSVSRDADNVWRFSFTDGTSLAIQSDSFGPYGLAYMELCEKAATTDGVR
jgi:hypothetical protein